MCKEYVSLFHFLHSVTNPYFRNAGNTISKLKFMTIHNNSLKPAGSQYTGENQKKNINRALVWLKGIQSNVAVKLSEKNIQFERPKKMCQHGE